MDTFITNLHAINQPSLGQYSGSESQRQRRIAEHLEASHRYRRIHGMCVHIVGITFGKKLTYELMVGCSLRLCDLGSFLKPLRLSFHMHASRRVGE